MTTILASLRSSRLATWSPPSEPFDELNLDDRQLESRIRELCTNGYFSIPIAPCTMQFLESLAALMPHDPVATNICDLRGSTYEQTATAFATRVLAHLVPGTLALQPHEFQLRQPDAKIASNWHHDKAPKLLTCITTLVGTGTEFVTPQVAESKFQRTVHYGMPYEVTMHPVAGNAAIASHIQTMERGRIYVFVARGLKNSRVPSLLHRAPGTAGRTIFMARWKELAIDSSITLPSPRRASRPSLLQAKRRT